MKNMKISHQLFSIVAVLMVAFAAVTCYQVRTSLTAISNERYDMLRTQVESGISILQFYYAKEKAGELSHEEAQRQAYATVSAVKFEPAGYLWAFDAEITVQFHYNTKLVGTNFKGQPDKKGNLFREDMLTKAKAGGGISLYYWDKPGEPADELFEKATYSQFFEPWQIVVATGVYTDDLQAEVHQTIFQVASAWFAAFLVALGATVSVIRNITKPLSAVHTALRAVADEDVESAVPHIAMSNEIGTMAKATQELQEKIRERHVLAQLEEQQRQDLDRERQENFDAQQKEAASQAHVVATIGEALEKLATSDLTTRCGDLGPAYEKLRTNFNKALAHLEAAMSEVNAKGIDIGGAKEEIRRASNDLSQRTERQAANLEETSAALDELTVTVRQTAEGAKDASQRVTSVSLEADRSDVIVSEAITAMSSIERSSDEISKIIGVIDEIAFQTNLLALNAGVEAARAGESGKGFAVVAQEVRELAQRSATAAKEIKDQISRSSGEVQNGVRLVCETGEALKRISGQIGVASQIVEKIANSAAEQDLTLRSIASSLNQLDVATQHNAAMAEETTASAEALAKDTEELLTLISTFRVAAPVQASDLHKVSKAMRTAG